MHILIALSIGLTPLASATTDADQDARRRGHCLVHLSKLPMFTKRGQELTVDAPMRWYTYHLTPEGIVDVNKNVRVWSIREFEENGNLHGRVALQTRHAQEALITRALERADALPKDGEVSAELIDALDVCADTAGTNGTHAVRLRDEFSERAR